ncbi:22870_t:CDS:2, partial [Racocetra persica]
QIKDMNEIDKVIYFIEGLKYTTRIEVTYQASANLDKALDLAICRPVPIELDYARSSSSSQHYEKKRGIDEPNQPPHIITNNSLELIQVEKNRKRLLKFNGKINGHPAWILLDSEVSCNFIDNDFATQNKLILKTVSSLSVKLADKSKENYSCIMPTPISIRGKILWFSSMQQLAKVSNSKEIFTIHISQKSNKDTNTQQPEIQKILQNFKDVFPKNLSDYLPQNELLTILLILYQ